MLRPSGAHARVLGLIAVFVFMSVAITCGQSVPRNSLADLRSGFKGLKWGVGRDEFVVARPDVTLHRAHAETFLEYEARIGYVFRPDGKWYRMLVWISDPNRASDPVKMSVISDLIDYFGRPSKDGWTLPDLRIRVSSDGVIVIEALVDGRFGL
jgi:hypothetical protein